MRLSTLILIMFALLSGCSEPDRGYKSVDDFEAEAEAAITSYDAAAAQKLLGDDSVIFVDVREGPELEKDGRIPGSIHIPRGVLEYYIDPTHPRHNKIFSSGKKVIFYCAGGGRSVLATKLAGDMGVSDPINLEGGFSAWTEAGGTIDPPTARN